jgi:AcrR family transcriptional regulator
LPTLVPITAVGGGTHACYVFDSAEEHRAVLTAYLRRGIEGHQRVRYLADCRNEADVLDYLRRDGLDPEPYIASGQLRILSTDETYLSGGRFEPERMISQLRDEKEQALREGYRGLWCTGEMTWSLRGAPGSEHLGEYEQQLEELFGDGKITAVCQYDRRHFGKGALSPLTRAHRVLVVAEAGRKRVHGTQTVVDDAALRRRRGPPPLKGPSPDYLARQDQIVAAATEVFRAKGYEAGTLEDVAEALDIGRPALYYYIRSKNQLLWLIYQRVMTLIVVAMEQVIGIQDPAERLVAALRVHIASIIDNQDVFKVFFEERAALSSDDQATLRELESRYVRTFTATVAAAIEAGVLPPTDPRQTALAVIGLGTWLYKWFDPERDDPEAFIDTCVALLTDPRPRFRPAGSSGGRRAPDRTTDGVPTRPPPRRRRAR